MFDVDSLFCGFIIFVCVVLLAGSKRGIFKQGQISALTVSDPMAREPRTNALASDAAELTVGSANSVSSGSIFPRSWWRVWRVANRDATIPLSARSADALWSMEYGRLGGSRTGNNFNSANNDKGSLSQHDSIK